MSSKHKDALRWICMMKTGNISGQMYAIREESHSTGSPPRRQCFQAWGGATTLKPETLSRERPSSYAAGSKMKSTGNKNMPFMETNVPDQHTNTGSFQCPNQQTRPLDLAILVSMCQHSPAVKLPMEGRGGRRSMWMRCPPVLANQDPVKLHCSMEAIATVLLVLRLG